MTKNSLDSPINAYVLSGIFLFAIFSHVATFLVKTKSYVRLVFNRISGNGTIRRIIYSVHNCNRYPVTGQFSTISGNFDVTRPSLVVTPVSETFETNPIL